MPPTSDDATAQHVRRTLQALELLAEGPQSQADLARRLAVHRRTVRRLLARLVEEGYAEATQRGRQVAYAATPRLAVLGRRVADGLDLVALGRRHLAALDGELVGARFIALQEGDGVRLAHVEGATASLPRLGPLHATAAGKVFLSADTELLGEVLNHELLAFTAATLVTRADLLLALASVRTQGYALEDGEHRAGVRAVASGVRDHVGRAVAALGVTPLPGEGAEPLGPLVRAAALDFSAEIGCPMEQPQRPGKREIYGSSRYVTKLIP
jgi:DNA-binding IclR family transcriptional regulator